MKGEKRVTEVRPFEKNDTDRVVSAMAGAFADDALYRYFIPEDEARERFLRKFMAFRLRYGLKYGTVLVAGGGAGAAIFLAPGHQMGPKDLLLYGGLSAMLPCTKAQRERIMGFNDFADAIAAPAAERPCWHLSPICVEPSSQGKGLGKALVAYGLAQIQAVSQPCYLETQSEKNVAFYQACGFRVVSRTPVPGTGLDHWGMLWEPRV